jgi:hypothetical protein
VVQGATDRRKTLLVRSEDPGGLAARLDAWLADEGLAATG